MTHFGFSGAGDPGLGGPGPRCTGASGAIVCHAIDIAVRQVTRRIVTFTMCQRVICGCICGVWRLQDRYAMRSEVLADLR